MSPSSCGTSGSSLISVIKLMASGFSLVCGNRFSASVFSPASSTSNFTKLLGSLKGISGVNTGGPNSSFEVLTAILEMSGFSSGGSTFGFTSLSISFFEDLSFLGDFSLDLSLDFFSDL